MENCLKLDISGKKHQSYFMIRFLFLFIVVVTGEMSISKVVEILVTSSKFNLLDDAGLKPGRIL